MPHPVYPHPDRLAGDEATDGVWAVAKFVREGSNMLRVMRSTLLALRACVDIRVGPPPAAAQALSFELSRFCISQYSVSRATSSVRAYVALWQAHLRLWNGFPGQERIEVWVDQAVDVEGHLRAMAKTFNDLFLSQMMVQPEHGKWTKLTRSLDFLIPPCFTNGLLHKIVEHAGLGVTLTTMAAGRAFALNLHAKKLGPCGQAQSEPLNQ